VEVSGQLLASAALHPRKQIPVPTGLEVQSAVRSGPELGGEEKNLTSAGNRTPDIQPVANHFTD
jgi:hypothetical protein